MELKEFKRQVLPLRSKLLGMAKRFLTDTNEAEDMVQEVMMKLWSQRQNLDNCRSIEAFAMTIIQHACIDENRTHKVYEESSQGQQIADSTISAEYLLEIKDEVKLVRQIIFSLPTLQRDTIRMKDIEGYENEQIAEITGCNIEAVRSNLARARKKVREVFLNVIKERDKIC